MRRATLAMLLLALAACPLDIRVACPNDDSSPCGPGQFCVQGACSDAPIPFGAACSSDSDCGAGACATPFPGGYCVAGCDSGGQCPPGGACVGGTCFQACGQSSDCRAGYSCKAASSAVFAPMVCVPVA